MRDSFEFSFRASTPQTSEADCGVHPREVLMLQSGLCGCRFGSFHDRSPSLLDPNPRCGWPRDPFAEQPTVYVFDASSASTATPVNSEISAVFSRHLYLTQRVSLQVLANGGCRNM